MRAFTFEQEHGVELVRNVGRSEPRVERWTARFDKNTLQQLNSEGIEVKPRRTDADSETKSGGFRTRRLASHGEEVCESDPHWEDNNFCQYSDPDSDDETATDKGECERDMSTKLEDMAWNHSFVELVELGTTHGANELTGVRIGQLTNSSSSGYSPQVIVVGAIHGSKELLTGEVAWRVAEYFADEYVSENPDIRDLLDDRTLTVVPIMNPDGWDHWHKTGNTKRENGHPCEDKEHDGIDLNRNFRFGWKEAVDGHGCDGDRPGFQNPEPETKGMRALISHDTSSAVADITGKYKTAALADLHTIGAVVLSPTGLDPNRDMCGFSIDDYGELGNCTNPDQYPLYELFGTTRPTQSFMRLRNSPHHDRPYAHGSKGREFAYGYGGSMIAETMYGAMPGKKDDSYAQTIELRRPTKCDLKETPAQKFEKIASDQIDMTRNLLENAEKAADGTYVEETLGESVVMPHIYRASPKDQFPRLRFGTHKKWSANDISLTLGTPVDDPTIAGAEFKWWNIDYGGEPCSGSDCYTHEEPDIDACLGGGEGGEGRCSTIAAGKPLYFTDDSNWDKGPNANCNSWRFEDSRTKSGPEDTYYFELNPNCNASPRYLVRDPVSLDNTREVRLNFSYELHPSSHAFYVSDAELKVQVSNNGFQNCEWTEGSGCRTVTLIGHNSNDPRRGGYTNPLYRSPNFDVSDFDGEQGVQVRFVAENVPLSEGIQLRVYDVHYMGLK